MDLSIIIVSWRVKDLLRRCLQSIYNNSNNISLEIFVVDNNSGDETAEMVTSEFPRIHLIVNDKNVGFARANNQALKKAVGDYILLLNPDTEIFAGALEKSISFMQEYPDCGVMGAQLLNPDKSIQPSVRRFPSPWPILLLFLKLPKIFPHLKSVNRYLAADFDYTTTQKVEQVMGAYILVRREVLEKVGLLDKRFFLWFEEVDFCQRAWDNNYKVYYNSNVQAIHSGGQSFEQQKIIINQWRFFSSALKYFLKHGF